MPVVAGGTLNTTALVVPNIYVQIQPPNSLLLNGVPTNVLGIVGTATWGPVNVATIISDMGDYASTFGAVQSRKYDMGTAAAIAVQNGASNMRCIRVTDATDVAATVVVLTNCITFTALYSGTLGNSITVQVATGSKVGSFRAVVGIPGLAAEVFDNIVGSGNAFWIALAAAINNGTSVQRGPSNYITASAGVGVTAPALATYTLASGTDGATTITTAVLVGVDTIPRKGMYVLRGQKASVAMLADADDSSQWSTIDGFGLAEGIYMIQTIPAGTSVSAAVTAKQTTGALDSYSSKIMHGDWIYWNDPVNNTLRLVSPQAFVAGRLVNLSPEQSTLNKPLFGVVGSQKSGLPSTGLAQVYADADLQTLFLAGIDVIATPAPGGFYWAVRAGQNSSSNPSINGDNYTRLTNYIAATLAAGMGVYVGRLINLSLMQQVTSTLLSFLANMLQQGQLGTVDGSLPYGAICAPSNNPPTRTALGYLQADVQVQYQAINRFFIVNLTGGQTVQVTIQPPTPLPNR